MQPSRVFDDAMSMVSCRAVLILLLAAFSFLPGACGQDSENPGAGRRKAAGVTRIASIPIGAVFEPEMLLGMGRVRAGRAFLVDWPGSDDLVALTAHHLLGPPGGLPRPLSPDEIQSDFVSLTLHECGDGATSASCETTRLIHLPDAAPFDKEHGCGDVAAFLADGCPLQGFAVSPDRPKAGDGVWMVTRLSGADQPIERGMVESIEPGILWIRTALTSERMRGADGAPILDVEGRLLGICLSWTEENGALLVLAHPVERFLPAVDAGLKQLAVTESSRNR